LGESVRLLRNNLCRHDLGKDNINWLLTQKIAFLGLHWKFSAKKILGFRISAKLFSASNKSQIFGFASARKFYRRINQPGNLNIFLFYSLALKGILKNGLSLSNLFLD
jgi:hypothetical protein